MEVFIEENQALSFFKETEPIVILKKDMNLNTLTDN